MTREVRDQMTPEQRDMFEWPADLDASTGMSPMRRSTIVKSWVEKTRNMDVLDPEYKMDLDVLADYADEIAASMNTRKMDEIAYGMLEELEEKYPEVGMPSDPQTGAVVFGGFGPGGPYGPVEKAVPRGKAENKPLFQPKPKEMRDVVAEMDLEQQEVVWQAWHDSENELRSILDEVGPDATNEELVMTLQAEKGTTYKDWEDFSTRGKQGRRTLADNANAIEREGGSERND